MRTCLGCGVELEKNHPSERCLSCYRREEEKSKGYGKSAWRDHRAPDIHTYRHPRTREGEFM